VNEDDTPEMQMWVASLEGLAPTHLWKCECSRWRRCDYHRADWPLILDVSVEEFRSQFGEGPVPLGSALDLVLPRIEGRLATRRLRRERFFADSLFYWPMVGDASMWTDGQHRCQAAMDQGCELTLFAD